MHGSTSGVHIRSVVVSGITGLGPVSDGRRCGFVETYQSIPATVQFDVGATVLLPVFQGKASKLTRRSAHPINTLQRCSRSKYPINHSNAFREPFFHATFRGSFLSQVFIGDLPGNFGGSIEELIRHYPVLQPICLNAFMDILKKLVSLVGPDSDIWTPLEGNKADSTPITTAIIVNPDPSSIPTQHDLVTALHAANAVMSCMEMLLMRKDTVTELVKMGGFLASIH